MEITRGMLAAKFEAICPHLDERQQRRLMGAEARALGHAGSGWWPGPLASVTMPVHVVEGSATSIVDRAICAVVLENLRCAEHSVIEGAGHMVPLTHAAELSQALVRHLP